MRAESARHVVGDGVLTIPTYATGVAGAPLPQQELPDGPWQLTTQVTIDVAERFQQAGLLLYAADGDQRNQSNVASISGAAVAPRNAYGPTCVNGVVARDRGRPKSANVAPS